MLVANSIWFLWKGLLVVFAAKAQGSPSAWQCAYAGLSGAAISHTWQRNPGESIGLTSADGF